MVGGPGWGTGAAAGGGCVVGGMGVVGRGAVGPDRAPQPLISRVMPSIISSPSNAINSPSNAINEVIDTIT